MVKGGPGLSTRQPFPVEPVFTLIVIWSRQESTIPIVNIITEHLV